MKRENIVVQFKVRRPSEFGRQKNQKNKNASTSPDSLESAVQRILQGSQPAMITMPRYTRLI